MKLEWTEEDIIPGRIVGKIGEASRFMIGQVIEASDYIFINLGTGEVTSSLTKQRIVAHLNLSEFVPFEYLPPDPRKIGRKGGLARTANLSPERRTEIARGAANARWNKEQGT